MKTFTTIAAATALLASAGIASADSALPLNPNKSTQASGLAGLVGGAFAGGTVIAAVVVGALVLVTVANDDGSTTTSTVPAGSFF